MELENTSREWNVFLLLKRVLRLNSDSKWEASVSKCAYRCAFGPKVSPNGADSTCILAWCCFSPFLPSPSRIRLIGSLLDLRRT